MEKIEFHRRNPTLEEVVNLLRRVYDREYPAGAPQLYERLLPRLPDLIRTLVRDRLDALVSEESHGTITSHINLHDGDKCAMSMFFDPLVLRAHCDVGRDATLSSDDHTIAHVDTILPIVAHHLIEVAAGEHPPETLQRMGCVFFDVDGTKTIVDCTSHAHAGRYLESIAKFLCKPSALVADWLQKHGLQPKAYSYAGDEFIVILRSEERPVDRALLDAYGMVVKRAIAEDPGLSKCVEFTPEFVLSYAGWTDEQRAAYAADPDAMAEEYAAARSLLPDGQFIPSVSFGSATLAHGLHEALSPDTEEAKTLEELGINASRLMMACADAQLKRDKQEARENIQDPKWKAFYLRNGENRQLAEQNTKLQKMLEEMRQAAVHAVVR